MKEAIVTDIDGYYVEPEVVSVETEGVQPLYDDDEAPESWRAAQELYETSLDEYNAAKEEYENGDMEGLPSEPPAPVDF